MATKNVQTATPVVTVPGSPKEPGLIYREIDTPGAGHLIVEDIDSPRSKAKGNLGYADLPDPVAVPRMPFKIEE